VYNIKSKLPLLVVLGLMLGGWLISSCNKGDEASSVNAFLTDRGVWRLASVRTETFHGDTSKFKDTLNTECKFNQTFTFNNDGTCTYEYFHCLDQVTTGNWELVNVPLANNTNNNNNTDNSINTDSVILRSGMVCKDTSVVRKDPSVGGSSKPFSKAQVINLGQNSLILQVVRTDTLRKTPVVVLRRKVVDYGFIH
jgi:hypothetical protein